MVISENKDFTFQAKDLVIIDNKIEVSLLDLSFNEKLNALKIREKWIISNHKKIEAIKKSAEGGRSKEISYLSYTNKNLRAELEKIKFSAIAQNQGILYNTHEFQDYFKDLTITVKAKESNDLLLDDILLKNPELVLEKVSNYVNRLNTTDAIDFIKPIAQNHMYRISKMPIKQ